MGRVGDLEAVVVRKERRTKTESIHILDWFNRSTSRMLGLLRCEIARAHFLQLR
jgi:hypothetical protein